MRIGVLSSNLSQNAAGRAYVLAKVLQRRHEVTVFGPVRESGIWEPISDDPDVRYEVVSRGPTAFPRLLRTLTDARCQLLYAVKPQRDSFVLSLAQRLRESMPLVLDIDDWELAFVLQPADTPLPGGAVGLGMKFFRLVRRTALRTWLTSMERLARLADAITVSSTFLQRRFGGTLSGAHGRDTEAFDPARFDGRIQREEHGIPKTSRIAMFFGTPRRHKGVADLVEACERIRDPEFLLVLAGFDEGHHLTELARERLGNRVRIFGRQPFDRVPAFLSMADVVVIPQRSTAATIGQSPAKVFDAMAMARPVVATRVSDLPRYLDGCGWLVEPEDPDGIASAISEVLGDPDGAREAGIRARDRCIESYSWDFMETALDGMIRETKER